MKSLLIQRRHAHLLLELALYFAPPAVAAVLWFCIWGWDFYLTVPHILK